DPVHAASVDPLGETRGGRGRNGAGIDYDGAFPQRLLGAVLAEDDPLDGGGIGNTDPHNIGFFGGVGGGNCRGGSIQMLARGAVPHGYFVTRSHQTGGHGTPHDAQTEEGDTHALLLSKFGSGTRAKEPPARRPE